MYFQLCKPSAPRLIDGNQDDLAFGECAGATVHVRTSLRTTINHLRTSIVHRKDDGGEEFLQGILCLEKSLINLFPKSSIPEQQSQSVLRGVSHRFWFLNGGAVRPSLLGTTTVTCGTEDKPPPPQRDLTDCREPW